MSNFIVGTLTKKPEIFKQFFGAVIENHPYFNIEDIIVIDDTGLGKRVITDPRYEKVTWIPSLQPWSFARNANLLFEAALLLKKDLMLCNDDAYFTAANDMYAFETAHHFYPEAGIIAPLIKGKVGNPKQKHGEVQAIDEFVYIEDYLCFIAVYIPLSTIQKVGYLNEEVFNHEVYGYEDNDYCDRVKEAGLKLGLTTKVVVEHGYGTGVRRGNSTFRDKVDLVKLVEKGKERYEAEMARRKRLGF